MEPKKLIWVLALAVLILSACGAVTPFPTPTPSATSVPPTATKYVTPTPRPEWTTPHPILSDIRVRRAIAYCTDKDALIESVYPLLTPAQRDSLIMDTFIPKNHWAYAGEENIQRYPFDPQKGIALLKEAGWILPKDEEFRVNAKGEELSLKLETTTAIFRQTWTAVWVEQMKTCGIQIERFAPTWWFEDSTGASRRNFELEAAAWVTQADPGGRFLYACDQIPVAENGWSGQNRMGWCNPRASENIIRANNAILRQERIDAYRIVQEEFTQDMVSLPLFNRTETYAASANLTGFAPAPGQEYYNYNVQEWAKKDSDTVVLGFTQEPASLFTFEEDAFIANIAYQIIRPAQEIHLNYEFKATLVKSLPTIENGGTTNSDVEVTEGTMVVDSDGNVVALAPGVKVINAAGETIEFTGGTVTMKQLVSRFELIDGLTWEDGVLVSSADLELNKKISCDEDSGATSFIVCDKTANVEFLTDTVGYIQTWIPGVQDPLYFVPVWGLYPAHQITSDGRRLADVPAREWPTLAEVAEKPLAYGPYRLVEWVKGERLVFAANPYWVGGAPKSPRFVIRILTAETAVSALLNGEVDILGSETLAGVDKTLKDAEEAGLINIFIHPGGTWEHIDMNLYIK